MAQEPACERKSKALRAVEYILLAGCLCVFAIRATLTEGLQSGSANEPAALHDAVFSLAVSGVLIFSFLVWLLWGSLSGRFVYRVTRLEIGLAVFILAAIVCGFFAPDKRAAITYSITLIAPVIMAILLVQLLDSRAKVTLLLCVVAAIGVLNAYQCSDQRFAENQAMIDQYEKEPLSLLAPLGIEPGSFRQMMFEHRLYTRGVRGFFTNANSAGSFAILACFAGFSLAAGALKNRKTSAGGGLWAIASLTGVAILVFGLAVTFSKGALAAFGIAVALFGLIVGFGNWLRRHATVIIISCVAAGAIAVYLVVSYGLAHDGLPGGNSMMVRWQYWCASARMYADHPFIGVGPGNFADFYTRYKPPAALEAVADPHNFVLSILTQYGPLGLVGLLAMILAPLYGAVSAGTTVFARKAGVSRPTFKTLAVVYLVIIGAALLFVRPLILKIPYSTDSQIWIAVVIILYLAPAAVFGAGFLLFAGPQAGAEQTEKNYTVCLLCCGIVGCLIHNVIDFAMFEPAIFTCFWALMACVIAIGNNSARIRRAAPAAALRLTAICLVLLVGWAYLRYALIPVARAAGKSELAQRAAFAGQIEQADLLLTSAATDDPLSHACLKLNAGLHLEAARTGQQPQADLLRAEKLLLEASRRNKADFGCYEMLTEVYTGLAEAAENQLKTEWLTKAFESARQAVELYPGLDRLHFVLAQVAELLGRSEVAMKHYRLAVQIEDAYRGQFRAMYPGRGLFSRLGEERYRSAKERIKELSTGQLP